MSESPTSTNPAEPSLPPPSRLRVGGWASGRLLLPATVAGTGTLLWFLSYQIDSLDGRRAVINLMQLAAALIAACIAWWRARRGRGRARWHLVALGGGALCWAAGQLYWTVSETLLARPLPFPSLADVGFVASYPLLIAALALAPATRHVTSRLRQSLDWVVVACSILFVSWAAFLDTVFAGLDPSTLSGQLGLAYPLADILLVTVAASTIARTRGPWLRPLIYMSSGLVGIAGADIGFAYLESTGSYATGSLVDAGWILGWALVAWAAVAVPIHVAPSGARPIDPSGWLGRVLPAAALGGVAVSATVLHLVGDAFTGDPVLRLTGLGAFSLNIARALVARAESDAHAEQLSATASELTEVLNRHAIAFETARMGTFFVDLVSRTVRRSPELNALLGIGTDATTVSTDQAGDNLHPEDAQRVRHVIESAMAAEGDFDLEARIERPDGTSMWVRTQGRGLRNPDGTNAAIVGAVSDITDRVAAAGRLQQQAYQSAAVAELGQRILVATDLATIFDDTVLTVAETLGAPLCKVLQVEPGGDELRLLAGVGWRPGLVGHATVSTEMDSQAGFTLKVSEPVVVEDLASETRFRGPSLLRDHGVVSGVSVPIHTPAGPWGVIGVHTTTPRSFLTEEVSFLRSVANTLGAAVERVANEEQRRHKDLHDSLTDLPNRTLLVDRLAIAVAMARSTGRYVAVLHVGIDRFTLVNTTLGTHAGDHALVTIARRLGELCGPGDTLARLDGDEFAFAAIVDDSHGAVALATRALAAVAEPLVLGDPPQELFLCASIGVALANGTGNASSHLRDASIAAERASSRGGRRYELFDDRLRDRAFHRLQIEAELRHAITDGEIEPYYQPIVDIDTGRLAGVEALARWQHPTRGLLGPGEFLGAAEDAGLVSALGEAILWRSARDTARWNQLPGTSLTVSVNVAASQLDSSLLDVVGEVFATTDLSADRLCLEVVESALAEDGTSAIETLRALTARWPMHVHIDDFGTGHSSLSRLAFFPVTGLKIDRAFVSQLGQSPAARPVIAAIIDLGHALGLHVTAEGVETHEQLDDLRALGCDLAQGWLFARAMPSADVDQLLVDPTVLSAGTRTPTRPEAATR